MAHTGPETEPESAHEGRLIAGRYRLGTVLGRGGMGTVWRARDEMLDRQVAVKEVLVRHTLSEDERTAMRERTLREARATARLNHPGIVTVHDVADEDDRPWIVMELVPSRSLQEIVDTEGPLPPARVAAIGRQMVAALRASHAIGILHRDIKPANVLITAGAGEGAERAVLTDFGIAQVAGDATLTQTGLLVGSPAYMPPERARGERATPASDLWSLGATLYAACEGRPPHHRTDAMAVLAAVMTEEPPPPRNAGPLTPVLGGLLLRDPVRRVTAAQAEELLQQVATGTSPLPAPAPAPATRHDPSPYEGTAHLPFGGMPTGPAQAPALAPNPGKSPNIGLLVLVGALATIVIVLAAVLLVRPGGGDSGSQAGAGDEIRQSTVPQGQQESQTPASNPTSDPTKEPPPSTSGLRTGTGPGFSIGVPAGWTRSVEGTSVFWRDTGSAAYVQVDRTAWTGDPYAHWQQWESEVKANGALKQYRRVDLRTLSGLGYAAADLEFTWFGREGIPMHGIDRGVQVAAAGKQGGRPYAVFVAIPADQWDESREKVNNILDTFRP